MALRIRLTLQEYGVEFDDQKFLKVIGNDSSVQGVISILQKLLPSDKPAEEEESGSESEYSGSSDEDSDEDDDIYDMFYMTNDNTRGSVVGARSTFEGSSSSGVSLMTCDKKKRCSRSTSMLRSPK